MRIRPFFSYIYKFWTSPGTPLWLFGASKWIHVAFFSQAQFSTWTMESGSSNSILEQLRLHILGMIIHELAQKMSGNSFQYLKMTALPLSKSVIEFLLGPAVVIPTVWASDLPGPFWSDRLGSLDRAIHQLYTWWYDPYIHIHICTTSIRLIFARYIYIYVHYLIHYIICSFHSNNNNNTDDMHNPS